MFGIAEESFYLYTSLLTQDAVIHGWLYEGRCPLPPKHGIDTQAFAVSTRDPDGNVPIIFTLKGKHALEYTNFTSAQLQIPPYIPIVQGGGVFRTNKRVGASINPIDQNRPTSLYMAYKDSETDDLYFAFYSPVPI